MKPTAPLFTLAMALFLTPGLAQAGIEYSLSSVDINAYNGTPPDAGLIIDTSLIAPLNTTLFTLSDGGSHTFDLFKIWTDEKSVNLDDFTNQPFTTTLNFSAPSSSGSVGGITTTSTFFGFFSQGNVSWNAPPTIVNAPGVTYSIQLSETSFNNGGWNWGSFTPGEGYAGTVQATITQISSVPEPSSLVTGLTGSVLMGGGWYLRRRRQRRRAAA